MQRYLHELELMGYIKIVRGSRYKGFEYKVTSWNDLESLTNDTRQMIKEKFSNAMKTRII